MKPKWTNCLLLFILNALKPFKSIFNKKHEVWSMQFITDFSDRNIGPQCMWLWALQTYKHMRGGDKCDEIDSYVINCATMWYANLLHTFDCFTCPLPINSSLPGLPLTGQTLEQIHTAAITIKKKKNKTSFRVLLSPFTGGRISSRYTHPV